MYLMMQLINSSQVLNANSKVAAAEELTLPYLAPFDADAQADAGDVADAGADVIAVADFYADFDANSKVAAEEESTLP